MNLTRMKPKKSTKNKEELIEIDIINIEKYNYDSDVSENEDIIVTIPDMDQFNLIEKENDKKSIQKKILQKKKKNFFQDDDEVNDDDFYFEDEFQNLQKIKK
jgi:hypothetical protein